MADILRKVTEEETEILARQEYEARRLEELAAEELGSAQAGQVRSRGGHGQKLTVADDPTEYSEDGVASILNIVKEEVDRRISESNRLASLEQRRRMRGQIRGDTPQERYYQNPFRVHDLQRGGGIQQMCQSYLDGLCWVLNYYLQGVPSWAWFYPFHYAPCASDVRDTVIRLASSAPTLTYRRDFSSPLHPVEQLLSVLPPESAHALPVSCRGLMTSVNASPLADIYHPKDIMIDRGNDMSWLWVILLPFIDVNRIIQATKECEAHFTLEEQKRNSFGPAFLYLNALQCASNVSESSTTSPAETTKEDLRSRLNYSGPVYPLYGYVSRQSPEFDNDIPIPAYPDDDDADENEDAENTETDTKGSDETIEIVCFQYFFPNESIHRSALIEGLLPMSSPLDLRVKRGGRGGRGRGGRGGRGRGRGRNSEGPEGEGGRKGRHDHDHGHTHHHGQR